MAIDNNNINITKYIVQISLKLTVTVLAIYCSSKVGKTLDSHQKLMTALLESINKLYMIVQIHIMYTYKYSKSTG